MKIAILGGTGTLGHMLVEKLHGSADRILIYSRDECKQADMKKVWPEYPDNKMRYLIGDIRDRDRLTRALRGYDYVIHAAAMKRIEVCQHDVYECVKTNVLGTMEVCRAAIDAGVKRCIFTSTDKSCSSDTAYGSSKYMGEQLFINSNAMGDTDFLCVRYPNVKGSRGSVFTVWEEQFKQGVPLTVTHEDMTRMWISISDAADFVLDRLKHGTPGVVYVPKCSGESLLSSLKARYGDVPYEVTGLRGSEKMHEQLISETEALSTYESARYYGIYPTIHTWTEHIVPEGHRVPDNFVYRSDGYVKRERDLSGHDRESINGEGVEERSSSQEMVPGVPSDHTPDADELVEQDTKRSEQSDVQHSKPKAGRAKKSGGRGHRADRDQLGTQTR